MVSVLLFFFESRRWFKGADTPLLAKFLQYRYCRALADCDEADEPVFRTIHAGLKHINGFMRAIYEQPLWVEPNDAANIAQMGLGFMRALNLAAQQALDLQRPRFKIQPKVHLFAHLVHGMFLASQSGATSLNILAHSCQMDEDFIGKISMQSRHVSIRSVHCRTIQRYCLNLALKW